MTSRPFLLTLVLLLIRASAAFAQEETNSFPLEDTTERVFDLMLPSEHLLGDWGGLRSKLESLGITPRLIEITDLAGNPIGGRSQGVTAPSSVELSLYFDLDKIAGLDGGSIFASLSERWGRSLSTTYIGNVFGAQQIYGFQTYRLIDLSYQQKLFDDHIELRLGRFAGTDDFLVSPYGFRVRAECVLRKPIWHSPGYPGHERVLRDLGGAGEGKTY